MASANFYNLSDMLSKGLVDFDNDTFYCALVTGAPTLSWVYRSDITNECTDSDYTAADAFNVTPAGAPSSTNGVTSITFANGAPAYSTATISASGAIIFKRVGADLTTPADDPLIAYVDFTQTVSSTAGDYNVTFTDTLDITI